MNTTLALFIQMIFWLALFVILFIRYNQEKHLLICIWSLSEMQRKYPVGIIGVDNDSKNWIAESFQACGVPYFPMTQYSCGFARLCGLRKLSICRLAFASWTELAQRTETHTDIICGEDGNLALQLKQLGKIAFVCKRKARAVTVYGTIEATLKHM